MTATTSSDIQGIKSALHETLRPKKILHPLNPVVMGAKPQD